MNLYRLVYCSRNRIRGNEEEVAEELRQILASARANNAPASVTGALLYNSGNFAQVLEGPVSEVSRIFEKIQRDLRHSEVTVVQSGRVEERMFPNWSMAFAGGSSKESNPSAAAAFHSAFSHSAGAGERIMSALRELVHQEDDRVLVDRA